ncbi:hydantoinase/oxoprolinase N-terminal domain-containing protein [Savagea serpentis]|nr:hydantoinase/oxoprolinase family protein [Savagea serpentis]
MIRLGIDVGGTNTDGVLMDESYRVITSMKTPTTDDVFTGIQTIIQQFASHPAVNLEDIQVATLGTTHCTNAIVERKQLNRVGVIRLSLPSGTTIPPFLGWPNDLVEALQPEIALIHGGYEYNGEPISHIRHEELDHVIEQMRGKVESIAVCGVFSPVLQDQEKYVVEYLQRAFPNMPISMSSEIGSVGLIERENATILNAALMTTIRQVSQGFRRALKEAGIEAAIYLGQNDGTLMTGDYAEQYPIFTIACGPTNSIRGAAHLSNVDNAIVVDIGGTTTDIGVLVNSFPRQTSLAVEVGGVRTNYRMPDIYAIGFGGGTCVTQQNESWKVGPESVGYCLMQEAISFGGETLTATDVALAVGELEIEGADCSRITEPVHDIYPLFTQLVAEAVDRMKTSATPIPVILVGGGAALMPTVLEGASEVIRPAHASVANAVGAALGDISGTVEKVYALENITHEDALQQAKEEAIEQAVEAGAERSKIEVIELEDYPLAYMPGNAILVKVKVAGPLAL